MRCPNCGKMDFYFISRFSISTRKSFKQKCNCGANLLAIGTKNHKTYSLQLQCLMCESNHISYYKQDKLWYPDIFHVLCPETGVEICFLGNKEKVMDSVKKQEKSIGEMAEDIGYNDFFYSPFVMGQILEKVDFLSKRGRLGCNCGSIHLDIDVYEDRIELSCPNCNAVADLTAVDEDSVAIINELEEIVLIEDSYQQLENIVIKKRANKNSSNKRDNIF